MSLLLVGETGFSLHIKNIISFPSYASYLLFLFLSTYCQEGSEYFLRQDKRVVNSTKSQVITRTCFSSLLRNIPCTKATKSLLTSRKILSTVCL